MRFVFVFILTLITSMTANAFTVEGPYRGGTDAIDHLMNSARWADGENSFVETGERGLGGGIEYTFDESLCDLRFEDDTSCEDVKLALHEAFAMWTEGHPRLFFTDVTGLVEPAFPLAAMQRPDQGAELDIFASPPSRFPPFQRPTVHGYTFYYTRFGETLRMTNGSTMIPSGGRYESADIRFNTASLYTMDPASDCQRCVHFPSLALHEIGHVLGIGHPDELAQFNLDTDNSPENAVNIDCTNPSAGLRYLPNIDGAAIAIGKDVHSSGRWLRGPTYDDIAARDALYPHCEIADRERFVRSWGGLARTDTGQTVLISGQSSEERAKDVTLETCEQNHGASCEFLSAFNACIAYASDGRGGYAFAEREKSSEARAVAALECQEDTGRMCTITGQACAFDTP